MSTPLPTRRQPKRSTVMKNHQLSKVEVRNNLAERAPRKQLEAQLQQPTTAQPTTARERLNAMYNSNLDKVLADQRRPTAFHTANADMAYLSPSTAFAARVLPTDVFHSPELSYLHHHRQHHDSSFTVRAHSSSTTDGEPARSSTSDEAYGAPFVADEAIRTEPGFHSFSSECLQQCIQGLDNNDRELNRIICACLESNFGPAFKSFLLSMRPHLTATTATISARAALETAKAKAASIRDDIRNVFDLHPIVSGLKLRSKQLSNNVDSAQEFLQTLTPGFSQAAFEAGFSTCGNTTVADQDWVVLSLGTAAEKLATAQFEVEVCRHDVARAVEVERRLDDDKVSLVSLVLVLSKSYKNQREADRLDQILMLYAE